MGSIRLCPAYLAGQWRLEEPDDYDHQRAATRVALLDAYATLGDWLLQQLHGADSALAFAVIEHQRRMLESLLGYALERGLWVQALAIAEPLDGYWSSRGLTEDARGWVDRARLYLEAADGKPPPLDDPAGALWLFLVSSQANRQLTALKLETAERIYLDIHDVLQHQPESPQQLRRLAALYLQLGTVANERGRLNDAQNWHLKSLVINEALGDQLGMATRYHQLGIVAQKQGHLNNAQDCYLRSLAINEDLDNRPGMAANYHQMGMVAQQRGHLNDAQGWYLKSLTVRDELSDRPGMAISYHQLGIVADLWGHLDDAQEWCLKALAINEELENRPLIATNCHQLGIVAQQRGHLNDAQDWCLKALTIDEELGNRPGIALSSVQMGLLAEARGHPQEAMEWMIQCVVLFDEFPHPATGRGPSGIARLTALLGIDTLEKCWRGVTGQPLPHVVRDFIASDPAGHAT